MNNAIDINSKKDMRPIVTKLLTEQTAEIKRLSAHNEALRNTVITHAETIRSLNKQVKRANEFLCAASLMAVALGIGLTCAMAAIK